MSSASEGAEVRRRLVPARTAWSQTLAYSRAVRVGEMVFVSGTLPVDPLGEVVGGDDAQMQADCVLRIIESALLDAGSALSDVVRLRIYLKSAADLEAVGRAQRMAFATVQPACTVVICSLASDAFRVQMDADAVVMNPASRAKPP